MPEVPPRNASPSESGLLDDLEILLRLGLVKERGERDGSPVIDLTADGLQVALELDRLERSRSREYVVMFTVRVGEEDDPRIDTPQDALAYVVTSNMMANHIWVVDAVATGTRTWLTQAEVLRPFAPPRTVARPEE